MEILIGCIIGLVLGLTGAGGSIFAVPLLTFGLGLPPQEAIGISLGAVGASAVFGVLTQLRSKNILWLPALVFAVIGALISPLGVYLNSLLPPTIIMLAFSILTIIIAVRLWRQSRLKPEQTNWVRSSVKTNDEASITLCKMNDNAEFTLGRRCILGMSYSAGLTGLLSGLFGVGGGFLIVPSLLFLTNIKIQQAIATSLVIISVVSLSGFASFISLGSSIDFSLLSQIIFGGVLGMTTGFFLSQYIAGPVLQKIFVLLMLAMALITITLSLFI